MFFIKTNTVVTNFVTTFFVCFELEIFYLRLYYDVTEGKESILTQGFKCTLHPSSFLKMELNISFCIGIK
jgi:hypothetical protein